MSSLSLSGESEKLDANDLLTGIQNVAIAGGNGVGGVRELGGGERVEG